LLFRPSAGFRPGRALSGGVMGLRLRLRPPGRGYENNNILNDPEITFLVGIPLPPRRSQSSSHAICDDRMPCIRPSCGPCLRPLFRNLCPSLVASSFPLPSGPQSLTMLAARPFMLMPRIRVLFPDPLPRGRITTPGVMRPDLILASWRSLLIACHRVSTTHLGRSFRQSTSKNGGLVASLPRWPRSSPTK